MGVRMGTKNPNWRGGRTVTSAGYVLLRLPDHPNADVRGYIYEHRVVMEKELGRSLRPGEQVRRVDGDPANNSPRNLVLVKPLDREAMTTCACGCGTTMTVLDNAGRKRLFVSGHNSQRRSTTRRPKSEHGISIPQDEREWLTDLFVGLCAYGCGEPPTAWDHVIPWSGGGLFAMPGNTVPACKLCNSRKSDSDPWPWIDRGMASDQAGAWVDVLALALDSGALEVPAA